MIRERALGEIECARRISPRENPSIQRELGAGDVEAGVTRCGDIAVRPIEIEGLGDLDGAVGGYIDPRPMIATLNVVGMPIAAPPTNHINWRRGAGRGG